MDCCGRSVGWGLSLQKRGGNCARHTFGAGANVVAGRNASGGEARETVLQLPLDWTAGVTGRYVSEQYCSGLDGTPGMLCCNRVWVLLYCRGSNGPPSSQNALVGPHSLSTDRYARLRPDCPEEIGPVCLGCHVRPECTTAIVLLGLEPTTEWSKRTAAA